MERLCRAPSSIGRFFAVYLSEKEAPYESQSLRKMAYLQQEERAGAKIRRIERHHHTDDVQIKMLPGIKACVQ